MYNVLYINSIIEFISYELSKNLTVIQNQD